MPLLGTTHIWNFITNRNTNGSKSYIPLFTNTRLHEIRWWTQIIRYHCHGIKVCGYLGLIPHQSEHIHSLLIKRCNGDLATLHIPPITSTTGCYPNSHTTLLQPLQHTIHSCHILSRLSRLGLWISINMLLGMNTQQIPSHTKRHSQSIRSNLMSRHIRHMRGQIPHLLPHSLKQTRHHLRIRLGLMIGQKDDILPRINLLPCLFQIVLSQHHTMFQIH
mmetsp:Transcript_6489/g.9554  ORF Transcript_6489/g.9554 Transcript_6489/m.9554 type:complete len:219 (-) Transcript_6489:660-1316(-)